MTNRVSALTWSLFALVFAWKAALVICCALPVPSNDSFFYDGAVVHFLEQGRYFNPSIRLALPISGSEVFSAYPPLYQAALLVWMWCWGTSAFAAMMFHLLLFGGYMLVLMALFKSLRVAPWPAAMGALFLFAITFNDRPDSLAHLLGLLSIYFWVRAAPAKLELDIDVAGRYVLSRGGFAWLAAIASLLTFMTSLQVGVVYLLAMFVGWAALGPSRLREFPIGPAIAALCLPALFAGGIAFGAPRLWQGFLEHAGQTPSFTGLRLPAIEDVLKLTRNLPGLLFVACSIPFGFRKCWAEVLAGTTPARLLLATTLASLAIAGGAMVALTPNALTFAMYLQPLAVALWLSIWGPSPKGLRWQFLAFTCLALIAAIRAIGISTWGVALAVNCGYEPALRIVHSELKDRPPGSAVVLSSAYLYEAYRRREFEAFHSDWMRPGDRNLSNADSDWNGLLTLRPSRILLTPFDYYRRYEPTIRNLQQHPELGTVRVIVHGSLHPPDASPWFRRVVQHLSWAPVVIRVDWVRESAAPPEP